MKLDEFILEEKSSSKMLGQSFSPTLDYGSYIVSISKTASKKVGALTCFMNFFLSVLLFFSMNLPYSLALNNVIMSGLVLLVATWI